MAADEATAMAYARRYRKPVEVRGLTTETSRTWAQPDGTFRAEFSLAPERVRDSSGSWSEIDLTLERKADGGVGPRVHARGLRLAGGSAAGSHDLVTLGSGSERSTLGWRGALPEPVLNGPKATYVDVQPGVDLVVQVSPAGYEYFLVVKSPAAAAGLGRIAMPWRTGSAMAAESAPGRGIRLRAGSGASVVVSHAEMWDERVSPRTGERVRRADVGLAIESDGAGGSDLVLRPDQAFFRDPGLQYPVTIDPAINLSPAFDTFVQNTYSSDQSGSTDLKLGYSDDAANGCGSGCTARSFLSFHNLSGYDGATVLSAELFLWNYHSWSCTAASWQAWETSYVNSTARWTDQPTWVQLDGTSTGTKGYGGCADGWVSVSVKKTFQSSFNTSSSSTANVGLRAGSESNHDGWKRFFSSEASDHRPYVSLSYNRTPGVPNTQTIDSCYTACSSPAIVRSGTPTISAKVSDPDGGTLRAEYEVYDGAKTTLKAKSGTAVTGVKSGTAKPWRIVPTSGTKLPDGVYNWRARACDSYTCGGYSGWFTFTIDTSDPSLPTVAGTPYSEKATGTWNGGPGQSGSFVFGANGATEISEYVYSLNGGSAVTVPAGTATGSQKLSTNQRYVSTDTSGFLHSPYAAMARNTSFGHSGSDSLMIQPRPLTTSYQTYATFGSEDGLQVGMQAGRRYTISAWIYVPIGTMQVTQSSYSRTIGVRYEDEDGGHIVLSNRASKVNTWEQLTLAVTLPAGATEASVRLYNGTSGFDFATGTYTTRPVYFDDMSVVEEGGLSRTITPNRDGVNVLSVQSRNAAGATSDPRIYQFLVKPSTGSWNWTLDENTGTAAASVPDTRPATLSATGATWTSPGRVGSAAVAFDGTGSATTTSPVLDTANPAGFTVAAWVLKSGTGGAVRTAVSQDGTDTSMFRLGYRDDRDLNADGVNDPAWCFTLARSDIPAPLQDSACTTDYVVDDEWVSLVGVYDKTLGELRLYVNGTPDFGGTLATATTGTPWSATGSFAMGRGRDGAAAAEFWTGELDHVYASQRVWVDTEIIQHALQ